MVRMTFSISGKLKTKLDSRPDINWPEIFKEGLGKKLEGKIQQINTRQVEIARSVCPKNGFVAGNVGPNAVLLERDGGDYTLSMFREAFDEQIEALVKGGVDLFSIETMYYIEEAEEAIKSAKEASDIPIIVAMTFDKFAEGYRTPLDNVEVKESITRLEKAGADVVGCGCTLGSFEMIGLAKEIKKVATKPVIIQPTAGAPLTVAGKNLYPIDPTRFANDMLEIQKLGVEVIGGCCGTSTKHIKKMIEVVKKKK